MKIVQPLNLNPDHFDVGETIGVKFPPSDTIEIIRPLNLSDSTSLKELLELSKQKSETLTDYNIGTPEEISNLWPIIDDRHSIIEVFEDLDLRHHPIELPNTKIILKRREDGTYPKLILGGDSTKVWNPKQVLGTILSEFYDHINPITDQITVEIIGAKNQEISIKQTQGIHLKMMTDNASRSIAYSTFTFNFVSLLRIGSPEDESNLWCNENKFFLNRIYTLKVQGKYNHNNNLFWGGSFDFLGSSIIFESGRHNYLHQVRLEEISKIQFDAQTSNNVIETSWHSSIQKNFQYGTKNYEIIDKGSLNRVIPSVVKSSIAARIIHRTFGLEKTLNWNPIVRSDYVDIEAFKDLIVFDWDNKNASYLVVCECYDGSGNPIKPDLIESPFLTWNESAKRLQGNYPGGQIYGSRYLIIKDDKVKFIKVGLNNNNRQTEASSYFLADVYSEKPRFRGTFDFPTP